MTKRRMKKKTKKRLSEVDNANDLLNCDLLNYDLHR
jgi:hypothetical protein